MVISINEVDSHFVEELFCIIETNVFLIVRCDIRFSSSVVGELCGVGTLYGIEVACKKCSHTTDLSVLLVLVGSLLLFVLIHACSFSCFMDNKSILTKFRVFVIIIT